MVNMRLSVWLIIAFAILTLLATPLSTQEGQVFETGYEAPSKNQNTAGGNERIIEFARRQWVVKSGYGGPASGPFFYNV